MVFLSAGKHQLKKNKKFSRYRLYRERRMNPTYIAPMITKNIRILARGVIFTFTALGILNLPFAFAEVPENMQYGFFKEPPVTLIEAAQLANEFMRSMNLPSNCFLRGIVFAPTLTQDINPHYVVYFRPQDGLISVDRSRSPITAEFEFMNVWMDKKVTIERQTGKVVKPSESK
jgi:hypothetical protein